MSRLCRLLCLCVLIPSWVEVAPVVVQLTTSTRTPVSDSKTVAFTSPVGAGRLLVACASWFNSAGAGVTVSDTVNAGTYTTGFTIGGAADQLIGCFYKENVTAGATSVTFNPTGSNADMDLVLFEISGVATGATIDVSVTNTGTFDPTVGATTSVATGTLAQADELVLSMFSHTGGDATLTGDTGDGFTQAYENEGTATGQAGHVQYKITTAATALTVNGTIGTAAGPTRTWFTGVVSFKGGVPDTIAPTNPSNLVLTITGSPTAALTWTASTDNIGVLNYSVERCAGVSCTPAPLALSVLNSYSDSGLTAATLYRYRVRASDGTNFSGYSNIAEGTTLAARQVTVLWTDTNSTPDNEQGYVVERKTGTTGAYAPFPPTAANAASYIDTSSPTLTTGPSACYRVKATASGYIDSAYSTEACAPAVTVTPPPGLTYGTFLNPCGANTYYNLPIKDGATRTNNAVHTNGNTLGQWLNAIFFRPVLLYHSQAGDPVRTLKQRTFPDGNSADENQDVCNPNRIYTNTWPTVTMKLPDSLNADYTNQDNLAAIVNETGGVVDGLYFAKCFTANGSDPAPTSPAFRFAPSTATQGQPVTPYPLTGDCLPFRGGAGGTQLSYFAGVIRLGELTSAPGTPIPHTLQLMVPPVIMSKTGPSDGESTPSAGWRWPAKVADSCIATCYLGTDPQLETGSLITIPTAYNCDGLVTEPAKKICHALQTYGGQITDGSGKAPTTRNWSVNIEGDENCFGGAGGVAACGVHAELIATYSIDATQSDYRTNCANINSVATGALVPPTRNFCTDLQTLDNQLVLLKNNSFTQQKGVDRPKFASALKIDATHVDVLLSSPDLALQNATTCTAWSLTDNGAPRAISACPLSLSSTVTLTTATLGAGPFLVSYTEQGTGTARVRTDPDSGGTVWELVGFMNQSVNPGVGTPSILRQASFQFYAPGSPYESTAPDDLTARAAVNTSTSVRRGGMVALRVQVVCDGGTAECVQQGAAPWCALDGGAHTMVPDSCATSEICYWPTVPGIAQGQTLLTERLPSTYPNLPGQAFKRQTSVLLGGAGSHQTEKEVLDDLQLAPTATASTIDCRLQKDGGPLFAGGYQATPARIVPQPPLWVKSGF